MPRVAIIDKKTGIALSISEAAVSEDDLSHGTQDGMDLAMIITPDAKVGDVWTKGSGFALTVAPTASEANLRIAMDKFGLAPDAVDEIFKIAATM